MMHTMARLCVLRRLLLGARRVCERVLKRWNGVVSLHKEDPVRELDVESPSAPSAVPSFDSLVDDGSCLGKLPVELVLAIFHQCDPGIKARIKLTHTCRRWRVIAVKNASLWTQVKMIVCDHRKDVRTFNNFLRLLGMQLDRTGDLLLDVMWMDDVINEWNEKLIKLLRKKAPVSRWRSLTVCLWGRDATPDNLFGPNETFRNLKHLAILCRTVEPVIRAIDRMTTSTLQVLDLSDWYSINALEEVYLQSLSNVSTVILPKKQHPFANNFFLPPNVTALEARWRHGHPFPYLQTYKLSQCTFKRRRLIDLRNLTSLVVTAVLEVFAHCEVNLPSLLYLSHARINLGKSAKIEAPLLETLHIKVKHPAEISSYERAAMDTALHHPGYRLSAKNSLIVEWCLADKPLSRLLELSPQVENVSLWFSDTMALYWIMRRMFGAEAFHPFISREDLSGTLCSQLKVLRLYFFWDTEARAMAWNMKYRKEIASEAVKSRIDSGVVPEIYGMWKELGTSIRLA